MVKKTIEIGKIAAQKRAENVYEDEWVCFRDLQQQLQESFTSELEKAAETASKEWTHPFYIMVITGRHADNPNVIKQQFIARQTRPKPDYDTTLYKYTPSTGQFDYQWTVPDRGMVEEYALLNPSQVLKDEEELWKMTVAFVQGKLI